MPHIPDYEPAVPPRDPRRPSAATHSQSLLSAIGLAANGAVMLSGILRGGGYGEEEKPRVAALMLLAGAAPIAALLCLALPAARRGQKRGELAVVLILNLLALLMFLRSMRTVVDMW